MPIPRDCLAVATVFALDEFGLELTVARIDVTPLAPLHRVVFIGT
jgi:hypothetical protein